MFKVIVNNTEAPSVIAAGQVVQVQLQSAPRAGEPGQGVPTGGTTGQILAKVDGTDYNTEWVDPEVGAGGITNEDSIVNAIIFG